MGCDVIGKEVGMVMMMMMMMRREKLLIELVILIGRKDSTRDGKNRELAQNLTMRDQICQFKKYHPYTSQHIYITQSIRQHHSPPTWEQVPTQDPNPQP